MPHKYNRAHVSIFDTVYQRAEKWRKHFKMSRSDFYNEAVFMHCNNMVRWYPQVEVEWNKQGGRNV